MPSARASQKELSAGPVTAIPNFLRSASFDAPHQLLAALFKSRTVGVGIIDRDLRFKAVNKSLASMHGLPQRGMLGKTLREVMGDDAKPLEPILRRNFATGQFSSAWWMTQLLGQKRKIEILDRFPLTKEDGTIDEVAYVAVRVPEGGKWEQRLSSGSAVQELPLCKAAKLGQPELLPAFVLSAALFQGLGSAEVDTILKSARIHKAASGEYLCRQGETTKNLYLLKTGLIKVNSTTVTGKEVLLRWVRPGEVFGLGTLVKLPLRNRWNAVAAEPSVAIQWNKITIERLSTSHPALLPNAIWIGLHWAYELQTRVEQMATERVEQRLARLVIDLSSISNTSETAELRVSDEELAQIIGTTLFTVSKVLSRWKRAGYVQKGRKRLLILNRGALSQISKGWMDSSSPQLQTAAIRKPEAFAAEGGTRVQ